MKSTLHIAPILLLASASAMADDITIDPTPFVSTATRAEVVAELGRFKSAGRSPWSILYNPLATFRSTKTRAEVHAEYLRSRDNVAAMNGEDSGSTLLARRPAPVDGEARSPTASVHPSR